MKKLIESLKNSAASKILCIAIFATMFSVIGWAVPEAYYKYFDTTEYLTVRYPMGTDKDVYAPCDDITVISVYTALQDINATSYNNWMQMNDDGSFTKTVATKRSGVFLKDHDQPFSVKLQIPCELTTGTYFLSGIKTYDILGNQKQYSFVSDPFDVKE